MNCAYRLIWNECLNAWSVVPEIARARGKGGAGKRSAAVLLLTLAFGSHAALAADLAATALPGGAQVTAGQATVSTSGASMAINQSSQRAIINWQNFDIGSQAQVNFQQPNASAVALNRVSGPTASRIEGQLGANGQVFLVNPNGVLFGGGARVNVGALAVSTLNIRDDDFLGGNYLFTGSGGSIANQGQISAAPGGYLAFISPTITNSGTLNAPRGTVAMGAGERVRLNFAGDRLVGLDVSADTIDTLITNSQAIRAEGGAILLTAAGAEAVTRSAINNTGVLEAGSLTRDGGRIVLSAGGDINLGAGSTVAVDGKKGGEITAQAQSGTLLADGQLTARGAGGTGGTVRLLGRQVGLVNAAQVDASGAMGGGTVLVGGGYQGKNPDVQNAQRTFVDSSVIIKADAAESGNGGRVVVWADEITRYYGSISAKGGSQGGDGGFVEVSGKRNLGFNGLVDTTAANGAFGTLLLDPTDITVVAGATPSPPAAADGLWSFSEDPGSQTIGAGAIASLLNTNNLTLQATNNIVVSSAIAYSGAPNRTLTLQANNNITVSQGISSTAGRLGMVLTADADSMGGGSLAVNAALSSRGGDISLSGVSVSSTAAITTTGATNNNGGNLVVNGTSIAGNINLAGAVVTTGGTASAGSGRNAGDVTIYGAGVVTTGAITANGNNGNGANQAGGNGGTVAITSNGILITGNLTASGGNGGQVAGSVAAGGNAGSIAVTNNSTTSGTLTTGTLTARAGVARGAIVSGTAGSVNVTNKAATLLQTGAIDTRGQAGGAGGNVALNSAGGVTVTSATPANGTIQTSGGALNGTAVAAGRNAGNVTIQGVNRSVTGAITASGGAAIVAGNAGGAGGNVLITGTDGSIATAGTLRTAGITARSGNAVGTVASGTAGSITLEATQINATGALDTRGGNNGAGGNVVLTSTGTLSINGAIATSGGAANASSAGRNAGNVTISGAGITSSAAGTITASGSGATTAGSNQPGGAGGAIQVSSTNGITLGAAVAASGSAATTTNANGGNAGSIAINNSGSGNISTTMLTASTGAATGTGAGGNAGFVSVTNTAANGNLTTRAITTTGGAKGNGGNVTLNALGAVSTNSSNITTLGGAGIGSAGSNAGNVTIIGGGVNLGTGTVTANGGLGNGANQAGGNGATVQITSTNGITANGTINATGGNGVAGIANGGNSGIINISNSTAGTIQTGALSARNGAAFSTGVGGSVGSIVVTNTADNVTLGALTTSGQANGDGGNISANATGLLTLNGAIASSGGANVAATTQAGKNAGLVTLVGNAGITNAAAATITASGSAGLGANQAGGNAGAVSFTSSTGAISARAITARTGDATGTGTGGTAGSIDLSGTSVTTNAGALTTTGGANGNGGAIIATASTGLLNVGVITTSGGTASAGTAGKNAGAVTLNGNSVTTLGITANGANGNNGVGGAGGNVSVIGMANAVTVGAISTIGGNGVGGNSAGGNAGTIADTLNIGAADRTISSRGGSAGLGAGGNITLGGPIYDNGTVRLLSVTGGSGTVTVGGGAANATQANNLDRLVVTASDGAGKIRVGSVNTVAAQSYDAGSGGVELNGNVATLGSAGADTVTFSDPVTLTGNSSITTAGGSGDNIAISQTVNGAFGLTLNAGAVGNVSTSAVIGGGTPLTAFSATGAAVTFGQSVTAGSIFARSTTGNMTLNAGAVLTGTGAGNAIELVAGGAASRFINNAGAGALNASNTAGRFLVWSQNPANDTRGGLVYAFKQYNATYGVTPVADTSANNDGFLYVLVPTITPGLTGSVAKVYDGTTTAVLATGNFTATGAVDGDTVTLSGTGTYANRNVGTAKTVTATGITASASNGAATVYGYQVNPASASANIGTITQAALTLNAVTDSKAYDGTTTSAGSVAASNLQTGDTYTASQSFDSRNAGARTLAVNGGYVINDGNGGNNYTVNAATAAGSITAAPLTVTAQPDSRVYDGTTGSAVAPVATGITYDAVGTAATQSYDNRNVGTGKMLTAGGLVMNDGNGGANYAVSYIANNTGVISPAALVLNASSATKVYDGTTASSGVVGVVGLQGGDTLSGLSQRFASKNVLGANGSTLRVDAGYVVSDGNGGANYAVTTSTALGTITPAGLSLHAVSDSKVYDGTTSSGGVVSTVGLVGGDTLGGLAQRFASKNVLGTNGSTLAVNAGYVVSDGNGGANYTVTTSTAPGTIMPASMVIAADDKSRPFGAPNPPFTASYAGFVAGETAVVLDGTLSFLTAATTSSAPGGYSITPFGQTSGNYAIAYVDGTLMVVGAPVRPGAGGETAADQQAIGAQYTSRGMPDDVLSRIRYVFADDKCKDASGTTDVPCAGGSVVRMVNGGILLPRQ